MSRWPMGMASLPRIAWRSRASCHAVMAAACAGRALRAASAVPSISARCMRSAVRGMCQSDGADDVAASAHGCGCAKRRTEALVAPLSRRKAARTNASDGWRGRQTSRPSTVRQARKAQPACRASVQPCRRDQIEQRGTHNRIASSQRDAASVARSRCTACIRHSPCGVDTSSSSPSTSRRNAVAAPMPRCGRTHHPAARHRHRPGSSPARAR